MGGRINIPSKHGSAIYSKNRRVRNDQNTRQVYVLTENKKDENSKTAGGVMNMVEENCYCHTINSSPQRPLPCISTTMVLIWWTRQRCHHITRNGINAYTPKVGRSKRHKIRDNFNA